MKKLNFFFYQHIGVKFTILDCRRLKALNPLHRIRGIEIKARAIIKSCEHLLADSKLRCNDGNSVNGHFAHHHTLSVKPRRH